MGESGTGVFIDHHQANNSYFASNPKHQLEKAKLVLEALGCRSVSSLGMCESFWDAQQQAEGEVAIGAYESGMFLADKKLWEFMENRDSLVCAIRRRSGRPILARWAKSGTQSKIRFASSHAF